MCVRYECVRDFLVSFSLAYHIFSKHTEGHLKFPWHAPITQTLAVVQVLKNNYFYPQAFELWFVLCSWSFPNTAWDVLCSSSSRTERGHATYLRNSPWTSLLHKHYPVERTHAHTHTHTVCHHFVLWVTETKTYTSKAITLSIMRILRGPRSSPIRKPANIVDIVLCLHVLSVMTSPNRWSSLGLVVKNESRPERNTCKGLLSCVCVLHVNV